MKQKILLLALVILAFFVRFVGIEKYPAGLNADEAAIGYNAWSLIQTGKDEHGVSWPLVFRSFDDYKPPVYFYLVLPFVKFLGLSVLAVRLPSVILGALTVLLVYQISKLMFKSKEDQTLSFVVATIFAFSPWAIHFSRGGWEVNAALFFIVLGIYGFFKSLDNYKYLYLFVLAFAISLYTYHSARLISPFIAVSLIAIYWPSLLKKENFKAYSSWSLWLKNVLLSFSLGIIVCLPLVTQMLSKEGQSRFAGVSVFSDEGPLWQALEMRREHPQGLYGRIVHNKYLSYSLRFTKNYLSHFSPRFLFVVGDEIARSKVPGQGQFAIFFAPFYFLGLFVLLKQNNSGKKLILCWLLIAPLAAAATFQSPHALRSQNMVVPLSFVLGLGVVEFFGLFKSKLFPQIAFWSVFVYFFAVYTYQYFITYPRLLPYAWQYGFDQIADYTAKNGYKYEKIIITDRYDQPYILMAFFLKFPPERMQKEIVMTPRDKFGFSTVRKLDKYEFRLINFDADKKLQNTLIISADEGVDDKMVIDTIKDPAGNTMYKIIDTNVQK